MKFFGKGQAALEFLTTYGWAFLVILVMIGGLSYFGVFDFKSRLPDDCTFSGNSVDCISYQLNNGSSSGQVQIRIKNLGDKDMTIAGIDILERSMADDNKPFCSSDNVAVTPSGTISPRAEADIVFDFNDQVDTACGLFGSEKATYDVILKHTVTGSTIESSTTGVITTTVATK